MAKFRSNHNRGRRGKNNMSRVISFLVLLVMGGVYLYKNYSGLDFNTNPSHSNQSTQTEYPQDLPAIQSRDYLPEGANGQIVHHQFYSLAYVEKHEQAAWVAYEVSRKRLNSKKVPRAKKFRPDYDVDSRSAYHRDYSNSGYTRGHLAPAGDMNFHQTAMQESFYMSNMSPQIRPFNNGIWRELEEQVRDWGRKFEHLYVVTGPILSDIKKTIGKENRVSVPSEFYKVILDLTDPEIKAIAFIIPHEKSEKHLHDYAVSIDEVEKRTGLDLFPVLLDDEIEEEIESQVETKLWKVNKNRFNNRVQHWNNQ